MNRRELLAGLVALPAVVLPLNVLTDAPYERFVNLIHSKLGHILSHAEHAELYPAASATGLPIEFTLGTDERPVPRYIPIDVLWREPGTEHYHSYTLWTDSEPWMKRRT